MDNSNKNIDITKKAKNPSSKGKLFVPIFLLLVIAAVGILWFFISKKQSLITSPVFVNQEPAVISPTFTPVPSPILPSVPNRKILATDYHIFQSFNNCGPAALSMALRFYGINVSQAELGNALRPYQIPGGDNDDKSVTLEELAEKSKEYGFIPFHRPMGNPQLVKQFIANDMPVITRTWTAPSEDIGHYRVIKGYDETFGIFIQDDSLQNKNLEYTFADFNEIWKKFNYEYLVLVPQEKQKLAEQILGENSNEKITWQNAVENSENEILSSPNDIYARFNLSVALYNIQDYKRSAEEFEKVENLLPFRTLWYQIEPIKAYYELGNYDRVFLITDRILNNFNRAFSELYILRGKIYQKQGNIQAARSEFERAVFYNSNLEEAKSLLSAI